LSPPILDPIRGALLRSQPDGRLVSLAREGRERALEEIVRRYRRPLVAFAAMIVPPHRADDVVQESLLRAFEALRASDAEIQLRPWLFRIARNQALNDVRDTPVHDELTEELDGVASPEEIAERRAELAALVGGLRALPDAQREAILARELEGRGHAEIAAELGTSPGAVRQLIFRARATLRGAAGLLLPLPVLRFLLGPGGSEAAGAAVTGAAAAAAGTAGGGAAAGVAGKVAVGLAGVALAVGGGIAAERGRDGGDRIASAEGAERSDPASGRPSSAAGGGPGSDSSAGGGEDRSGSGDSAGPGGGGSGGHGDSGPGGGGGSGPGDGGGDSGGDSSGPGSTSSGHGGSGSSGSGGSGGDLDGLDPDEIEPLQADSSGPSDSSGSGSSGSGSSGSGTSGSGTSGSDSSGSGSSGSGISGSGSSESGSSGSGWSGSGDELEP
jgi:RNA polymerase sigma factor (sigma-70 family)